MNPLQESLLSFLTQAGPATLSRLCQGACDQKQDAHAAMLIDARATEGTGQRLPCGSCSAWCCKAGVPPSGMKAQAVRKQQNREC